MMAKKTPVTRKRTLADTSSMVPPAAASTEQVQQYHTATPIKKRKIQRITLLQDIRIKDCFFKPIQKRPKCNIMPIVHASDGKSAVLVQLSGGGAVPPFGVEREDSDKSCVLLTLQLDDAEEEKHLVRLWTELCDEAVAHWESWFPGNALAETAIRQNCTPFTKEGKKKRESEERWSATCKVKFNEKDVDGGKCAIRDAATMEPVAIDDLRKMRWEKAIIELEWVYFQATRRFGMRRKLRSLICSPAPADAMLHQTLDISDICMGDCQLRPLQKNTKCNLMMIVPSSEGRGRIRIRLSGTGRIPFNVDREDSDKSRLRLALEIGDKSEEEHLVILSQSFCEEAVKNWKSWFPQSGEDASFVRDSYVGMVKEGKQKQNSEERWNSRCLVKFTEEDVEHGRCKIEEAGTGEKIEVENLRGMRWQTAVVELSWIYFQQKQFGLKRKLCELTCWPAEEEGEIVFL